MTFAFRDGRRILKKPFKEALQRWHIRIISFTTQMCLIVLTLLITMSRLASSDHQISGNWSLKYHYSPWLHKEFVDSYKSDSYCQSNKMMNKCYKEDNLVNSHTRLAKDRDRILLKNVTDINIKSSSNGSTSKTNNNNDISTASVFTTRASDGTIATSPAPKFTDTLLALNNQCLFLDGKSAKTICDSSQGVPRLRLLERFHLKYCNRYPLVNVLSSDAWQMLLHSVDGHQCEQILSELQMIDNIVNQLFCEYHSLLERYDCENGFSVEWTCNDCLKVYRDWVCSMLMPFHINGVPIKPCQSFCERVEQRCPHLHPYGKGQYAGEPVFLCIDPNIPFNPSITPSIPYADSWLCYDSCHLTKGDDSLIVKKHESEANEEHCISYSELLYNNMATTTSIPDKFDAITELSVTSVPLESQWSETILNQKFSRTTSKMSSTSVTLPKIDSDIHVSKESAKSTANHMNSDGDRSDPNNDNWFSSTADSLAEILDTNESSISSSAGYSTKKSIIRLPIIVLLILLHYCWVSNDLRVLFIELSDLR